MLCNNNLCYTTHIIALFIRVKMIIFRTMYKDYDIGIIFDCSRFS